MKRAIASCVIALAAVAGLGARPTADTPLETLLARAGTYLSGYIPLLSAVTGEEEYRQRFVRRPTISASVGRAYRTGDRTLRSDILLVRMPTAWMVFRDVLAVDGKPVRAPGNRLERVFLDNWVTAVVSAAEIDDRCGQYDIGDVNRPLSHPLMALQFLDTSNQARFEFKLGLPDDVEGVRASRIEYRETATPTFIAPDRADAFTSGTVWVEPASGRIVKTLLKLVYARERRWLNLQVTVLYRPFEGVTAWLPAETQERWQSDVGDTNTVATYRNYRRLQAPTEPR